MACEGKETRRGDEEWLSGHSQAYNERPAVPSERGTPRPGIFNATLRANSLWHSKPASSFQGHCAHRNLLVGSIILILQPLQAVPKE